MDTRSTTTVLSIIGRRNLVLRTRGCGPPRVGIFILSNNKCFLCFGVGSNARVGTRVCGRSLMGRLHALARGYQGSWRAILAGTKGGVLRRGAVTSVGSVTATATPERFRLSCSAAIRSMCRGLDTHTSTFGVPFGVGRKVPKGHVSFRGKPGLSIAV